jgi:hypothetical protein
MAPLRCLREATGMQVLHSQPVAAGSRRSILAGAIIGLLLIGLGAALAYLALATPFSRRFIPEPHSSSVRTVTDALGGTLLVVAPVTAAIAGMAWLANAARQASIMRTKPHPTVSLARFLGPEYAAASNVRLPDGRTVVEIVVGPHGLAVFEPMPPPALVRTQEGRWELRAGRDRWIPLENPLEHAVRSADRVRHWLTNEDRGFVVRIHAAVVTSDPSSIARSPTCAVVSREQVPAYLRSLPVQRGFSPDRRAQIVAIVRAAA